jgi:PAS domain S-box-containing protein
MAMSDKVNVLLVDDQPAKLLAYETILQDLGENLIKAASAREALEHLLKTEIAILLIDVCMPELDGFELAAMIREHPRFQETAIIFVSAIQISDIDRMRGYEMGAVDYVPVPVIPEVLRAKVRIFAELHRKKRQLEQLNLDLERRVAERTAELEASNDRLRESERRRSLALEAGRMGSWDWDVASGTWACDAGQYRIFGLDPRDEPLSFTDIRTFIHDEDLAQLHGQIQQAADGDGTFQIEIRVLHPSGRARWCLCAAAVTCDARGAPLRVSGVMIDITELKDAEERRALLVREVDHRARNALAVVQSIVRLTKAKSMGNYVAKVEGRINALANAHVLLSESRWEGADLHKLVEEELAPYRDRGTERVTMSGPRILLKPGVAQTIAIVLHELATNAAKYGALSQEGGAIVISWRCDSERLTIQWRESGGPSVQEPTSLGFGTKVIKASLMQQLGGAATFEWLPAGLQFTMSGILGETAPGAVRVLPSSGTEQRTTGDPLVVGQRLLLVEDEALIGLMMKDVLTELGFQVVGPLTRIRDAIDILGSEPIHAAVLDVNLREELIYPLADEIAGRGIPFVFVTGYGPESIDARFSDIPVLQKPVDRSVLRKVLIPAEEMTLR